MDRTHKLTLGNVGVFYWRKEGLFHRDRFWALKDVSFVLRRGETLGVVGRNGAGKSTLLRLLAGIIKPDRGEVECDGGQTSLLSLQVGFNPNLSGRDNAVLSGMLLGMKRREVIGKMDEIVDFSELEDFIDQPVRTYSTGMKARLGFAVAFQVDPDLLLIDEVIGVGDDVFRKKSTDAMSKRIRSNKTAVVVSHNSNIIRQLCDRVVWIDDGKTRAEGEAGKVLESYSEYLRRISAKKANAIA